MHNFLLIVHNLLRWVVVIAAVVSVVQAFRGWRGNLPWTASDNRNGMIFTSVMDLQLLIGLLLMFVFNDLMKGALSNMGEAMSNALYRFFLMEHFPIMLVAIVVAHIGRARAKKKTDDAQKHRTTLIFFGVAFLLLLVAIPWPFVGEYARPWLRF